MKTSKVMVSIHPEQKKAILPTTSDKMFQAVLEQTSVVIRNNVFRTEKRTALVFGSVETLNAIGISDAGGSMPGKIWIKEQSTPFFEGQEAKINPETKATVTSGGNPVYRQGFYDPTGLAVDQLLENDKVEAVAPIAASSTVESAQA